jgi:hypothetical protein
VAKSLRGIVAVQQQVSLRVVPEEEVEWTLHSTVEEGARTMESLNSPGTWLDDLDTAVLLHLPRWEGQK